MIGHLATVTRALKPTGPDGTPADGPRDWALIQKRFLGMQLGLDRIHTLVRELLTFSRLDPGEYRFVNVPECIAAVLETLGHRLAGRIHVETRFGTPEGIQCNPQLLQQGVLNLLANGIDAIESEGTIEVTCMAERDDYVIRVTDNGHGIPVSIKDRVMEPFFTTRPVGTGTGLGLPVTYSLVLGHGGTIELLDGEIGRHGGRDSHSPVQREPVSPLGRAGCGIAPLLAHSLVERRHPRTGGTSRPHPLNPRRTRRAPASRG